MKRFLVTSPHSFCDSAIVTRHCDTCALDAGKDIVTNLKGHNITYHPNITDMRENRDYNRPETDNTAWREKLTQHASELKPDFVFEIHSYPGEHPLYVQLWPNAELVVFESEYNKKFIHRLVTALKYHDENIIIHIGHPWHPVSITEDMGKHSNVKKHTLFEFNEVIPRSRRKEIAATVTSAVLDIITNVDNKYPVNIERRRKMIIIAAVIIIIVIIVILAIGSTVWDDASYLFQSRPRVYTYPRGVELHMR